MDPAIVQFRTESDKLAWYWQAFIDDYRGSGPSDFIHPACFAETRGVRMLVAVVHRRDLVNVGRKEGGPVTEDYLPQEPPDSNE
jgi:hypothetical protein